MALENDGNEHIYMKIGSERVYRMAWKNPKRSHSYALQK